MNERIIKQLKQLKSIAPDNAFVSRSREIVINTTPAKRSRLALIFAWSGAAAMIMIIISISYIMSAPTMALSSSLNETKINEEIDSLSAGIEVQQITYEQKVSQTVTSALQEVGETKVNHLNESLLEKEVAGINKGSETEISEADALFDRAAK